MYVFLLIPRNPCGRHNEGQDSDQVAVVGGGGGRGGGGVFAV